MRIFWVAVVVCLVAVLADRAQGQPSYTLFFRLNGTHTLLPRLHSANPVQTDSAQVSIHLQQVLLKLQSRGYLLAAADSLVQTGDTLTVWLHLGEVYRWASLRPGNVPEALLRATGYREKLYTAKIVSPAALARLQEALLTESDNRGYPFASIRLDSIAILRDQISASLVYTPGPMIVFDTLTVRGTARLKAHFLAHYLRITPGQPYSEALMQRAQHWFRQLPFVRITAPYGVTFKNDRAYPVFFADSRQTSSIDGIVGVQPNELEANRLLVTGEMNLQLRNLFSTGKSLLLQWQQIKPASPRLDVSYWHPAFLRTPLELQANFNLLKQDSTFFNLTQQVSLGYALSGYGKIQFRTGLRNSRLGNAAASVDTLPVPAFADSRLVFYGVSYTWNNLDDLFYPLKGFQVLVSAEAGNKRILKNPLLKPDLYQELPLASVQFAVQTDIRKFTPVSQRSTLLTQARGGKLINQNLFGNELYRLGGLTSLRGFNENTFFASDFAAGTLEYRYFIEPNSYLFLFYDQAWLKYDIRSGYYEDGPFGVGAGMSLSTNAGIFSFVYALGQSKDRPFGLNYSKIHFGYTTRF